MLTSPVLALQDPKVDEKLDAADKEKLNAEITKVVQWLDESQSASKDEYECKYHGTLPHTRAFDEDMY